MFESGRNQSSCRTALLLIEDLRKFPVSKKAIASWKLLIVPVIFLENPGYTEGQSNFLYQLESHVLGDKDV